VSKSATSSVKQVADVTPQAQVVAKQAVASLTKETKAVSTAVTSIAATQSPPAKSAVKAAANVVSAVKEHVVETLSTHAGASAKVASFSAQSRPPVVQQIGGNSAVLSALKQANKAAAVDAVFAAAAKSSHAGGGIQPIPAAEWLQQLIWSDRSKSPQNSFAASKNLDSATSGDGANDELAPELVDAALATSLL
jgi:hypothetical protein